MSDNLHKLTTLLSRVFKVESSEVNDDMSPVNTKSWDSFNTLAMVIEIEKQFSISMPLEDVVSIKSVKDIKLLLLNKGVELEV